MIPHTSLVFFPVCFGEMLGMGFGRGVIAGRTCWSEGNGGTSLAGFRRRWMEGRNSPECLYDDHPLIITNA